MRLVNMDVDRFGDSGSCRLGPLSAGLNAICGPRGSGKTTLLRWLRQVAAECDAATDSLFRMSRDRWNTRSNLTVPFSVASGSVEISNRFVDFRVTTDRNGRMQFHSLRATEQDRSAVEYSSAPILSAVQRRVFEALAGTSVATDAARALEQLAASLDLGHNEAAEAEVTRLRSVARELESRLQRLSHAESRSALESRRRQLESELLRVEQDVPAVKYVGHEVEHRRYEQRRMAIEADLRDVLSSLETLDSKIASRVSQLNTLDETHDVPPIKLSFREQLQQLDDRLHRWRQTLRDLKSHREAIEHNATDARLDKQIGDQLSSTKESDPRAAMRSLEAQILGTRERLDMLVEKYRSIPGYGYRSASAAISSDPAEIDTDSPYSRSTGLRTESYRDGTRGPAPVRPDAQLPDSQLLPETLRAMQKDLQEVCQQLARFESKTATDTLRQQALQLKRCEDELLQSVEKLIEERAALLRTIANEHHVSVEQLTLAFGNWCQCHDHPHLREWLLSTEKAEANAFAGPSIDRQQLIEEIQDLKRERKQAELRADDCRRQLRDTELYRSAAERPNNSLASSRRSHEVRPVSEIQTELNQVRSALSAWSEYERTRLELDHTHKQLEDLTSKSGQPGWFQLAVDHHLSCMMPGRYRDASKHRWDGDRWAGHPDADRPKQRQYDLVDGLVTETEAVRSDHDSRPAASQPIIHLAMRLAIAEAMRDRGEPVSLILDQTVDNVSMELQGSVVSHLAHEADRGQQIVVLTADERVCELVRSRRGATHYLHRSVLSGTSESTVNRQLNALANDLEADKWVPSRATSVSEGPVSRYYLQESSLIEDLPSIEPAAAARCRALGVDRIRDLLDVDPYWLADSIQLEQVSHGVVIGWQAKARLLCSVKNLRPFDASVLVGVGIRTPAQLADMHPSELLERVEHFLSTDAGRRIMRSGSSYELSRITSWIASAEKGGGRVMRSSITDDETYSYNRSARSSHEKEKARGYREVDDDDSPSYATRPNSARRRSTNAHHAASGTSGGKRAAKHRQERRRSRSYPVIDRNGSRTRHWEREPEIASEQSSQQQGGTPKGASESADRLRFYLELSSPVVDAPSIGPRGAARLEEHEIYTVRDLLNADPESLANKLNSRKVKPDTVLQWQEQARLICRIPNLRGHDAQLLVACDFTSPEELATMDPEEVLDCVLDIARTKQGQRILRESSEPDLDEVSDWIHWAGNCRSLNAA